MAQTISSPFVGSAYEGILRACIQRAETFDSGSVAVHTGFNKALHFTKVNLTGDILQDYDGSGVDSGAVGTFSTTQSTKITLQDLSLKISNLDPNAYRAIFEPMQLSPSTLYTFPDLPPAIQQAFVLEVLEEISWVIDQNLWTGSRATAATYPTDRFNGWLTLLDTANDYIDATTSGATTFTAANIFTYMDAVKSVLYSNATAKAVESRRKNELKFFVSKNTAQLLQTAEQNTSGKGQTRLTSSGIYDMVYSGTAPIVPLSAFPDDQILLTYASTDPQRSNLQFGATNVSDQDNLQVFRMSNGSNYIGMRMDMAVGCVVPFTTECIRFIV